MADKHFTYSADSGKTGIISLTPIETIYNGFRFRSRTEARHAVYFDTLGITYNYELQGYHLEDTLYLPDFHLPDLDCYIEIKGLEPEQDEIKKAKLLSLYSDRRVFVIVGGPWPDARITAYMHGIRQDITHATRWAWYLCPECDKSGLVDLAFFATDNNIQSGFHNPGCDCQPTQLNLKDERITQAYVAARQARFEHQLQMA